MDRLRSMEATCDLGSRSFSGEIKTEGRPDWLRGMEGKDVEHICSVDSSLKELCMKESREME